MDHHHNIVPTGFRFQATLDSDRSIVSEPFFSATRFIPEEGDLDQFTYGVINLTIGASHYQNKVEINRLKISDKEELFSLTHIPDLNLPLTDLYLYLDLLSRQLG